MPQTVLVIEDEQAVREMLRFSLEQSGFTVVEAENTAYALDELNKTRPDCILLDWMLPGISGIEFARRLRRDDQTKDVPIIMLTARAEEEQKITGLDAGVDDYIIKPFSPRELVARIKAVIRRWGQTTDDSQLEAHGLVVDTVGHRVFGNNKQIDLGPTEYKLLQFFMSHPERVYSRTQLLDSVWGTNIFIEERTVDVHIRRLRKALENFGYDRYIQTVRGTGYRFSSRV